MIRKIQQSVESRTSILIIYTGGTIGMKKDEITGALVPFDFSGIYDEFPALRRLPVGISVYTMPKLIDSSNAQPSDGAARHRHHVIYRFGSQLYARESG